MLILWIPAGLAAAALAGRLASGWGAARDRRRFPPRGEMLAVGDRRLHVVRQTPQEPAPGAPTVVFEAALGGSSLSWWFVQRQVARFAPTLSYDRAGLGWSDAAPAPQAIESALADLRRTLAAARCAPPYVLVGHSYGGWVARLFASRHPDEVDGLVLVDSPDPAIWAAPDASRAAKLATAARLTKRGAWAARWGAGRLIAFLLLRGALPLGRLGMAWASGGQLLSRDDSPDGAAAAAMGERRPWAGMATFRPLLKLPADLRESLRVAWLRPSFYQAVAGAVANLPESAAHTLAAPLPPGLPVGVLTAADADEDHLRRQQDLAGGAGRFHARADGSGHWIPLDEPELVVEAVRRVACPAAAEWRQRA